MGELDGRADGAEELQAGARREPVVAMTSIGSPLTSSITR